MTSAAALIHWSNRLAVGALVLTIRAYQWTLAPLLGPCCRFEPSCSRYMIGALAKYGLLLGTWKGVCRVLKCHPWHPGGFDPP